MSGSSGEDSAFLALDDLSRSYVPFGARRMGHHARVDRIEFSAYQRAASETGGAVTTNHPVVYPTLGLTNEAGEVAGKIKKIFRDRGGVVTDADREALTLELGDVLWYVAEICTQLGIDLEDVAAANIAKLRGRQARGTLAGDGDTR